MAVNRSKKRKAWGIILITWPFAVMMMSILLFALFNLMFPGADGSVGGSIVNVLLWMAGLGALLLMVPSVAIGITLLAMKSLDKTSAELKLDGKADGLSVAGMVLGIFSAATAFFAFIPGIVAIVYSAIGLKRKPKGNGIAIAGLVTGIIGTVIGAIVSLFIVIAVYAGVQVGLTDTNVKNHSGLVAIAAEEYYVENGEYPNYIQIYGHMQQQGLLSSSVTLGELSSTSDVIYIPCYGDGAIIWYWSSYDEEYHDRFVGNTQTCEF